MSLQSRAARRKAIAATGALVAALSSSVAWAPLADAARPCKPRGSSCPTDNARPLVSITFPSAGSTVVGTVTVQGTASDDGAVSRVDVSVDGAVAGRATGTNSWSLPLDTTRYANGSHTVTATAVDGTGNSSSSTVSVSFQNSVADTAAPSVSITSPGAGATVSGAMTVAGSAGDDRGVARVEVAVDGAAAVVASGTASWSAGVDTRAYADGAHTITATAIDTSGNRSSRSVAVTVANSTTPPPPSSGAPAVDDTVVTDPKASGALKLLGRGRIATAGNLEVVLYWEEFTWPSRVVAHVKDISTGAVARIDLPSTAGPWTNPSPILTASGDLWVLTGDAPVVLRQYRLSGSPLPTSATLVSSRTFGDGDSRMGALIQLASGALVAVWHQQGSTGTEGHGIAYRRADGSWQEQFQFWAFTRASKDSLVQHPADGSVWLFNNADAWGGIGAAHLTEVTGGLRFDWADHTFIGSDEGQFDADPENPDIVAVADPYAGDVVLAYQSAVRQRFSDTVIGSYPVVARVRADGVLSFRHLPVWVSRVTWMGLSVRPGEVWLAHRRVEPTDLSTDSMELRVLRAGAWSDARSLGKATSLIAAPVGASFGLDATDRSLHLVRGR